MNPLIDFSFQRLVYQAVAAVLVIATHGLFLTLAARLLGDKGPEHDGRLTFNPFAHLDPIGAVALAFTQFGWVKPVAIDRDVLFARRLGPLLVALLALASTLALGWGLWSLRPVAYSAFTGNSFGTTVVGLLETGARTSLGFVLLNLVPILPLTAGHLLIGIAPRLAERLNKLRFVLGLAIVALIFFALGQGLGSTMFTLSRAFYS